MATAAGVPEGSPLLPEGEHRNDVFEELLDGEVMMNMNKLREAARRGIPASYRSLVYRYLLGVVQTDKSTEMSMERVLEKDFDSLLATHAQWWEGGAAAGAEDTQPSWVAAAPQLLLPASRRTVPLINAEESPSAHGGRCGGRVESDSHLAWANAFVALRQTPPYDGDLARRRQMETALCALQATYCDAAPDHVRVLVRLAIPFDRLCTQPRDTFFCTRMLYHLLCHSGNVLQDGRSMQQHCGSFLAAFRATNQLLYQHFFTEGIPALRWVPGLFDSLLAGRLYEDDLFRLWDYYLADSWESNSFALHPYVCLAILAEMTEDLIECDAEEIIRRLNFLPRIDADNIIRRAVAIRESLVSQGVV